MSLPLAADDEGGGVGLIIDARGCPLAIPTEQTARVAKLQTWLQAFGLPTTQE